MDKTKKEWLNNPVFKKLCDAVAKNNLVCLTGAGISKGLVLKNGAGAPDWHELLKNIKNMLENDLSDTEKDDLKELLSNNPSGENLIEASSILCSKNRNAFLKALSDSVDLKEGQTSLTHEYLLDLLPKGILTYNYDNAHETAIKKAKAKNKWKIILPSDELSIVDELKSNLKKPFLFKMHGTIKSKKTMVLTRESYRDLFIKYPFYKAFIQQIFTNYQLLIIGFGLSDPDFEMLLQNMFSTFGSPIQDHIVIKHIKDKSSKDVTYKLRYGLNFLYIEDFSHIPEILKDCMFTPGNIVNEIINNCSSSNLSIRSKSHSDVRALSDIGKKCLTNILEENIRRNIKKESSIDYNLNFVTSEYVYTYGIIAVATKDKKYKDFLIEEVVNKSSYSEPIAHALVHLRDILDKDDLGLVTNWLNVFRNKVYKEDPVNLDPYNRIYKYCESAYYLLKAKYGIE